MIKLSPFDIEERASEARAILASPAMKYAFAELEAEYLNQLIQAEVGGLTASTAHASMKVLRDVQSRLETFITEEKMQRNRGRS
jgi:hypothetical protein